MHFLGLENSVAMLRNMPEKFAKYVNEGVVIIASGYIRGDLELYENNKFSMVIDPVIAYKMEGIVRFHSAFSTDGGGSKTYWNNVAKELPRMHFIGKVINFSHDINTINVELDSWYSGNDLLYMYEEWNALLAMDNLLDTVKKISGDKEDIENTEKILRKELCSLCEKEAKRRDLVLQRYLEKSELKTAFEKDRHATFGNPISEFDKHLKIMKKATELKESTSVYFMLWGNVDSQGLLFTTDGIVFRGKEKGFFGKIDCVDISWDDLAEEWFKYRNQGYELFYLVKSGEMSIYGTDNDDIRFEISNNAYPAILNRFVNTMGKVLNGYVFDDFDILIPR